jgi:hypothetical protein
MPGDERAPRLTLDADEAVRLLETGEMQILGLLPRSSNYTFLVKVIPLTVAGSDEQPGEISPHDDSSTDLLAVYKPRAGETPLWDFPDGTLGLREVAAFRVARALGWPPATRRAAL